MYIELHCHSCFSLLDGVSRPEALAARAAALEMPALALTDHDALYGAVAFWRAAREAGVKPVFGVEMTVEDVLPRRGVALTRGSHPHPSPLPEGEGASSPVPLSLGGRGARGEGRAHFHATLLAEDDTGYASLSKLVTAARMRCQKGEALATWDDLAQYSTGVIALTGCRQGIVAQHLLARDEVGALRVAQDLRSLFGKDRFFVELQRQLQPGDERLVQGLLRVAEQAGAPVVATNNVHYAERAGHRLHDVLTAIRSHATLDASAMQRRGNSEAYLKSAAEMARLFADRPDALRRTVEIAERCNVTMRRGVQDLPLFHTGPVSQQEYLRSLCRQALAERYGPDPAERVQRMLQHELAVIEQLTLTNYFLIVWDIMRFAREQGIRCQGRGSAANSLVAYLLGITPIDPLAHDLVFERFLSAERPTTPDIDIDFQADRREEVIQYIYARYGREHAAMACTFVTYRQRSAVRDVAKTLDFPSDLIDALANAADRRGLAEAWGELWGGGGKERGREGEEGKGRKGNNAGVVSVSKTNHSPSTIHHSPISQPSPQPPIPNPQSLPPTPHPPLDRRTWQLLLHLCQEIMGLPRHLGIHNGGFVVSRRPLSEIAPLEPASMDARTVVQWDKESLEDGGLVKIDVLGLRMLSVLEETVGWIGEEAEEGKEGNEGKKGERGREGGGERVRVELDRLTFDDPAVYAMLSQGDTVGVFQVESRAQAQLLPRMRPRNFADLVVEISLIRPGPVQAGMVHPYLRRRLGEEPVTYLHPSLEPALRDTLGVVIFQEQVLKVAQALAGFSGGQGELLRRALGRKDGDAEMARLQQVFVAGATQRGVSTAVAEQVFRQLEAFGSYSFAKSHAAAFAVIVYQSAWLKRTHPVPFYVALLNNQPMGFWSSAVLVNDARHHGIAILPADVNESAVHYVPEDRSIRIGLAMVKRLGEIGAERIVAARADRPFTSLLDFCRRTRLPRLLVENLIVAGALDEVENRGGEGKGRKGSEERARGREGEGRRGLLWQLGLLHYEEETLLVGERPEPAPEELPPLQPLEAMAGELRVMGVSAGEHVMTFHREAVRKAGMLSSRDLAQCREGALVWVAGQVTVIQSPPTAKGFMFVTLEDEFSMMNIIVAPDIVARYRRIWRHSPLLAVQGRVQRQGPVINLLAVRPWRWRDRGG